MLLYMGIKAIIVSLAFKQAKGKTYWGTNLWITHVKNSSHNFK